MISDRN